MTPAVAAAADPSPASPTPEPPLNDAELRALRALILWGSHGFGASEPGPTCRAARAAVATREPK